MSSRSAARGSAAASSIRLTSRTSKAVATSRASPSRCFLFCRGSRAARSAPIAAATVAIPPTRKPPQARRVSPITERSSAPGNLMGGKVVRLKILVGVGRRDIAGVADDSLSLVHVQITVGQLQLQIGCDGIAQAGMERPSEAGVGSIRPERNDRRRDEPDAQHAFRDAVISHAFDPLMCEADTGTDEVRDAIPVAEVDVSIRESDERREARSDRIESALLLEI